MIENLKIWINAKKKLNFMRRISKDNEVKWSLRNHLFYDILQ